MHFKQYFNYFKVFFVILAVLLVAYIAIAAVRLSGDEERTNTECLTDERVFDYADVLTDEEEQKLRKLIAKKEEKADCDIVLVTLNESLKDYARERETDVPYDEFVRVYAEDFYDSNGYGYDKPIGTGTILVDNWFREDDGRVYTWFTAAGKADELYTGAMIDRVLDDVYEYIESDPYRAYAAYVNRVYCDMAGIDMDMQMPVYVPVTTALIAMLIFIALHWKSGKGKKTVSAGAYVNGGRPNINRKEDIFINKTVTKRHIQTSSSSGSSSGGGSHSHGGHHGGGGRSR